MSDMYDIVIRGGRVVTSSTSFDADVGILGEKIAAIGRELKGKTIVDASGMLVTPGAVDIHVHMEMSLGDGLVSSDDFFTGTRAAALGGTTCIVDFVEAKGKQTLMDAFQQRNRVAASKAVIDYAFHMTIGPNDIAKLDEVPAVYDAGCTSFKMYMAYGLRLTDDQMFRALQAVRDVGGFPVIHAENWDVITTLIEQNLARGNTSPHWHPRSRPAQLEGEAAGRVIDIATYLGVPVHIFHVSCGAVVERIARAKAAGLPVTGETCPQYLFLTHDAYDEPGVEGMLPVCAPPLRAKTEQAALWDALRLGALDIVTTDHCPFTRKEKLRGANDFSKIPGGVPSIEMRFSALYSEGVQKGHFSENRWVEMCCSKPAKFVGLANKGEIAVGFDADIVVFDPNAQKHLSTETLHENVDWTPYQGLAVQGWSRHTLSRGQWIVRDGEFVGETGRGKYVMRR